MGSLRRKNNNNNNNSKMCLLLLRAPQQTNLFLSRDNNFFFTWEIFFLFVLDLKKILFYLCCIFSIFFGEDGQTPQSATNSLCYVKRSTQHWSWLLLRSFTPLFSFGNDSPPLFFSLSPSHTHYATLYNISLSR